MCPCNGKTVRSVPPAPLQRFTFWDGQDLLAKDLNALERVSEERRRWHARAVHAAFGISYGLDVADPGTGKGRKTTKLVRVSPGLAYDCTGKLLLLQSSYDLPVPEGIPDGVESCLLLLRFLPAPDPACACSPPLRCCLGEPLRCREPVGFVWKDFASVTSKDGVPLARMLFQPGTKSRNPQLDGSFVPFRIRGLQRPHLLADRTVAGSTPWQAGPAGLRIKDPQRSETFFEPVDVLVDTTAAGFTRTPCYFATLSGSLFDKSRMRWLPVLSPHVTAEQPNSFIFRFWIPVGMPSATGTGAFIARNFNEFRNFANQLRLYVSWCGLEENGPAISLPPRKFVELLCSCGQAPLVS
jgi:hypothetical protein